MQMKHAERRQNILCHFVWWVRFSVSRDEPERERTKTVRTVGRGDIFPTQQSNVEHALEINFSARTPISRSKFQKKAKETIAGRKNKQTLIETVIENWLVCLFVTRARQLGSDSLKARHVIIVTFAYAQTSDHCTRLTRVTTVEQENRLNIVRFTNLK